MPKISVVIPCYNVADCLEECLDSVFKQTFSDFEIICVEDCSTDTTKRVLQKYKGSIQIVYHTTNKGLAISRNDGMKRATGKYIFFLDSDDTITPNCLELLYNEMEQNLECDVCCGAVQAYPDDRHNEFCVRQAKHINEWIKFKPFKNVKISAENFSDFYLLFNCLAWNKLYKHSFLTENNLFFINANCYHEDNGFWLKVLSCFPILTAIPEITYLYRIKKNSISDKMDKNKKKHIEHLKKSILDALTYVEKKNSIPCIQFIKSELYHLNKHLFVSFFWQKDEKHFKLFFIPIFKFKYNPKKRKIIVKIFGLPVFKKETK